MKIKILTLFICLGVVFFSSCNKDKDTLNGIWNLKNVSGGFAGINDDYEAGMVTWTFHDHNKTITVVNNSPAEKLYSGLESGTYSYSIVENNGREFLLINSEEYGGIVLTEKRFVIDQNEMLGGTGADFFILEFER